MKFSAFLKFEPRRQSHVFLFACEDDFLVDESRSVWTRVFGGEWAFERLSAKEFEALEGRELLEAAMSPPLFGPSRVLLVYDAGKVTKKKMAIAEEIAALAESSLKIIFAAASRRSLPKSGGQLPTIDIDPLRPSGAARWLRERYGVSPEVAAYLVDALGCPLLPLVQEMEKLTAYVRESRPVELSDVDLLTLRTGQSRPFELDDAVIAGNYRNAVGVAGAMIEEGVEPLIILSMLARVWRQLLRGTALADAASPGDIAAAARIPTWKASAFRTACARLSWPRLVRGFGELVAADKRFKTGAADPDLVLDLLLWNLLGPLREGHKDRG